MTKREELVALAACPFCGGEAHLQDADDGRLFYVVCLGADCYCAVGEGYDRDVNAARNILRVGLGTLAEGALA